MYHILTTLINYWNFHFVVHLLMDSNLTFPMHIQLYIQYIICRSITQIYFFDFDAFNFSSALCSSYCKNIVIFFEKNTEINYVLCYSYNVLFRKIPTIGILP